MTKLRMLLAASELMIAIAASHARAADQAATDAVDAQPIPDVLKVPAGNVLVVAAHGVGVQIYACLRADDDPTHFSWTLQAPEAALRDAAGDNLGKHYAGPAWEAGDGSIVMGELVAKYAVADAAAIPWLLLRAKSTSGSGIFGAIRFVQRLHTVGGLAPAEGCDRTQAAKVARVPYSADYRFYAAESASAIGIWKTFDDKSGNARGIVRIYERDGKLFGRIEQTFKPRGESRVCELCTDERKNQPIIGLIVIRNMKRDGKEYDGGDILDPESGSVYRCHMHLEHDGTRLILRGYIGFSLLGRSQTWQRQG